MVDDSWLDSGWSGLAKQWQRMIWWHMMTWLITLLIFDSSNSVRPAWGRLAALARVLASQGMGESAFDPAESWWCLWTVQKPWLVGEVPWNVHGHYVTLYVIMSDTLYVIIYWIRWILIYHSPGRLSFISPIAPIFRNGQRWNHWQLAGVKAMSWKTCFRKLCQTHPNTDCACGRLRSSNFFACVSWRGWRWQDVYGGPCRASNFWSWCIIEPLCNGIMVRNQQHSTTINTMFIIN